jgi:hypothetical protein
MKALSDYEPELKASIKRIHKLNKNILKLHWCSRTGNTSQDKLDEYQPYYAGDLTQK